MDTAKSVIRRKRRYLYLIVVLFLLAVWTIFVAFPVLNSLQTQRRQAKAGAEAALIVHASLVYLTNCHRMPLSGEALSSGAPDFTCGTYGFNTPVPILHQGDYQANNSELLAALMGLRVYQNAQPTVSTNQALNPGKRVFLHIERVSGPYPGIGPDGVYRDPWRNPYIVTLDIDNDGFCEDPLYGKVAGKVFVWSFGPDGKADPTVKPDEGVNADNISHGGKTNSP